ncbi:fructosamine kinase family protein [Amycolatopsis sp. FDAARGOS 1241]|uniref:fructosamine kinase family protein n=1 Tax=Amycolatopsis sp. FDAARGOS 1241 TaxID=2778070 RepID=UPI001952426F|nr:fructosamine kinase family protein [Amycolatopsis sp. FDAARGOS 1241]QRP48289.1 fructosamine kinase family protein [Amycolatopsis sp. FDAARGOS 1241]
MARVSPPDEVISRLTGRRVVRAARPGGALSDAELDDGPVVVKRGHAPGATTAEAAGLRWLAEPGAVAVARVRGSDHEWLVLDRIETARPTPEAAREFGRGLARLHAAGAPAFGSPPPDGPIDAWIGPAPMKDATGESWSTWFAEQRVLPYVRRAVDAGVLSSAEGVVFARACAAIPESAEPPARLHGDLWNGNVLWTAAGACLIDPAAHGGHRETDLAMLHLFGCPHLAEVVAAYDETAPLAAGWRDRIPLHQLFPLLVHTVLFGRSYAAQAIAAARTLV